MKRTIFILPVLFFLACGSESNPKPDFRKIEVVYYETTCCANLEVLNDLKIPREDSDSEFNRLMGVNMKGFSEVQYGDTLTIDFRYTDLQPVCEVICNVSEGIPVEIIRIHL